jgi:hypothetical protein
LACAPHPAARHADDPDRHPQALPRNDPQRPGAPCDTCRPAADRNKLLLGSMGLDLCCRPDGKIAAVSSTAGPCASLPVPHGRGSYRDGRTVGATWDWVHRLSVGSGRALPAFRGRSGDVDSYRKRGSLPAEPDLSKDASSNLSASPLYGLSWILPCVATLMVVLVPRAIFGPLTLPIPVRTDMIGAAVRSVRALLSRVMARRFEQVAYPS